MGILNNKEASKKEGKVKFALKLITMYEGRESNSRSEIDYENRPSSLTT